MREKEIMGRERRWQEEKRWKEIVKSKFNKWYKWVKEEEVIFKEKIERRTVSENSEI